MLKIHKSHSKSKLLIIPITSICITFGLLGFYYLTYTPELSHAESVTYKKTIEDITYMQEMTPSICQGMELEKQYQLIDKRDDKTYWIARLKDNNCWMTQNLAYDSPDAVFSYPNEWEHDNENNNYYNPGVYVYKFGSEKSAACSDQTTLENCSSWLNVKDWQQSKDSDFTEIYNSANRIYNAHYLSGNYYSFNAATDNSASILSSGNAPDDVCPANWRLPTGELSSSGSFGGLFSAYGTINGINVGSIDIRQKPFHFVLSGMTGYNKTITLVNSYGDYWTSSIVNLISAYTLHIEDSSLGHKIEYPSSYGGDGRYRGLSVRCVARSGSALNNNIEITVNPTISLDVANEVNVEKSETNPSTANLDVKVSSNQKYSVGISAVNPNLISATSEVKILAKSGLLNTAENGWGIKLKDNTNYTALTTSLQTFYTASGAEIKTIPFAIGISTALDIPNGEYSTEITVTATQN